MARRASAGKSDKSLRYGAPPSFGNRFRIRFIMWGALAGLGLIGARLAELQMEPDLVFTEKELHHIGFDEIFVPRGAIRDREGRVLATDRKAPSLWADPRKISDPDGTAAWLAAALNLNDEERRVAQRRLAPRNEDGSAKKFVWIQRWLDPGVLDALGELPAGVGVRLESTRFYPQGELAAQVLGFVNRESVGSAGVEMAFDSVLRSEPGKLVARVDGQRRILSSLTETFQPPEGGADVYLTVDLPTQYMLEEALDRRMAEVKAPRGMGIMMDPKTGAILALACRPSYDPNRYYDYDKALHRNRAVTDAFEPGSAFKIVVASAALEHNLITPETMINCEGGRWNPYGHPISDYHKLGVVPFRESFAESSNIAMIKLGQMLGPERFEEWVRRYGFGAVTSPDFRAESAGKFRPRSQWSRLSMGSLPMGQEVSVTMPQMAVAFGVIANGGYRVQPYIVEQAVGRDGTLVYRHEGSPPQRILSAETAAIMRELCHLVVIHPKGTGRYANIPEYRVGGKTGTAQISFEGVRGYDSKKYMAVFAGFAPLADPRVVVVLVISEPGIREHWGGYVCGPVFKEVVREYLTRTNCPEDPVAVAVNDKDAQSGDPDVWITFSDEDILEPLPESALASLTGSELHAANVDQSGVGPALPSFLGLTMRQVKEEMDALGIRWDFQGSGWARRQSPPAGTPLAEVDLCRVEFGGKADTG